MGGEKFNGFQSCHGVAVVVNQSNAPRVVSLRALDAAFIFWVVSQRLRSP